MIEGLDWKDIRTNYFYALQERAGLILKKASILRSEILSSDRIFKTGVGIPSSGFASDLYIYDPTLPSCKIVDNESARSYFKVFISEEDSEKIVQNVKEGRHPKAHFFSKRKSIRLHDLMDGERLKEAYPNEEITEINTRAPIWR